MMLTFFAMYSERYDPEANRVIDALGGTAVVAKLCEVNRQAVSQWRRNGLPDARRMYLRVIRPDVFSDSPTSQLVT